MKRLRWIAVRFGIALCFYACLYTSLNVLLSRRVESQRSQIEREGHPIVAGELGGENIPVEEDAGPAFRALCEIWEGRGNRWTGSGFDALDLKDGVLVKTRVPDSGSDPLAALGAEEIAELRRQLSEHEILSRLLEEIRRRPRCGTKLAFEEGPALPLPHLRTARSLARYCGVKASLAAIDSDYTRSADHFGESLALARCVAGDRFLLISHLVTIALERQAEIHIVRLFESFDFDEPSLARLQAEMEKLPDLREGWAEALIGERAIFGSIFASRLSGEQYVSNPLRRRVHGVARLFLLADYDAYLSSFPSVFEPQRLLEKKRGEKLEFPAYVTLTPRLLPAWNPTMMNTAKTLLVRRLTRFAIELRRHRIRTGSYPVSLDELVCPSGFPAPVNPFDEKPLVYERKGQGFRLTVASRKAWWPSSKGEENLEQGTINLSR